MLLCRKCRSRLLITNTYNRNSEMIERRLKCPECGQVYYSMEVLKKLEDVGNGKTKMGEAGSSV